MCGIAGIISPGHRSAIVPMIRALAHRGPDGEGFYEDGTIALGHRRLSIIDLEGGRQPIANEDGTLQLVCNGEIYNSPQLRRDLESRGHVFRTATDVEVILHLFEEYGRDCVQKLRGMFAFALWDSKRRRLFMARDHMGQKPLFYCRRGDEFLFASEVKGILASRIIEPEIDLDALWHYVSLRFIPDDRSLFKGIRKLQAATWLAREGEESVTGTYWSPHFREKLPGKEMEIEEGLHYLLQETVRMHLLSDVRVGAFLSGGIDSSTIAAMMAQVSGQVVPTFTIGVREQQFNELPYARMVSSRYGMEAHEQVVQADLIHLIPSMIYHMDEPADPFGVGVYLASQLAARNVKVVLSGDGGDENFAGYDRFAGQRMVDLYCILPKWFRKMFMARLIDRIPDSFGYKSFAQKAAWMNQMSFFTAGERYWQSMSFLRFADESRNMLFTAVAREELEDEDSSRKILRYFESENAEDLVDRMLFTDLMTRMPDHLLPVVDRMAMAHGVESRPPLVDYKVVEYAAAIPAHMKLKGRDLKHIFKKVAARYLPRELIYREKQGFAFPLALWMRTDLQLFMRNLFKESRFVAAGIFEQHHIDRLVDEHVSGRVDHNFRLWILINLEFWYRLYFENESVESLSAIIDGMMNEKILKDVKFAWVQGSGKL
jgi:asparagine synthase (glutamine-hydrolysing)